MNRSSSDDHHETARQPAARDTATQIVWATDPHLNHVDIQAWDRWIDAISKRRPDALILTGDISEGDDVVFQLNRIAETLMVPIYFVLGNHDFYQSSIGKTRQNVIAAARKNPLLRYLTDSGPIELSPGIFLLGDDGWGDATEGNYEQSPIRLNDFALIEDFKQADPGDWKSMLVQQGHLSAERLSAKLEALPESAQQVLVATHVPPFCESCWYEGHTTDENWAPFFVCGQLGRTLLSHFNQQPQRLATVLCGHTHHAGVAQMSENLVVYTGAAHYGAPDVEANVQLDGTIKLVMARQ